jgi:2-hydroxychromene-2-carboxylate isomerase
MITATLYNDPACPWGYSANPPLRALEWRYGDQLQWELVLIGLTESASQYEERGYTPQRAAYTPLVFRRFGMPFALGVKPRMSATARACRAVVAARLLEPGSEFAVFRALQLANFTTDLVLEDDAELAVTLNAAGFDGDRLIAGLDSNEVSDAYERDRAAARTAAGTPAELQGKTAASDGPVRYTAPSVVFTRGEQTLMAGGFQTIEAYDVLVANLDPTLHREPAPATPEPLLDRFAGGLTTQEVTAIMTEGNDAPDREAAERGLIELMAAGRAVRVPLGDDALWLAPHHQRAPSHANGAASSRLSSAGSPAG